MNKEECIEELKYIRKAYTEKTLSQWDTIIDVIWVITEYLENDGEERGETV